MFSGSVCGFIHVFFFKKSRCRPSVFVRFLDECWDGLNGLIVGFGVVKSWILARLGTGFWRG